MEPTAKISAISEAAFAYGQSSFLRAKTLKDFFFALLDEMPKVLGIPETSVNDVPPDDEWEFDEVYNWRAFPLMLRKPLDFEPCFAGLAIKIPHIRDNGSTPMRVALRLESIGDQIEIELYRLMPDHVRSFHRDDVTSACSFSADCLLAYFTGTSPNPPESKGQLGFHLPAADWKQVLPEMQKIERRHD